MFILFQEKHAHLLSCHGTGDSGESYRCDQCNKTFATEDSAYLHVKSRHSVTKQPEASRKLNEPVVLSPTSFQCQLCALVATSELAFWVHSHAR